MKKTTFSRIEDYGTVIYKCYAGSRSYGTNITEETAKEMAKERGGDWKDYMSDVDIRGIFIPHRKFLLGNQHVDEFKDPNDEDTVYFSLEKFIRLALECNPNVVEQLFVRDEDILYMNDIGRELRDLRHHFISKNAFARFGSYAHAQLKRMDVFNSEFRRNEKRMKLIEQGEEHFDRKNAMHLVRLFKMGIEILREGKVLTYRPDYKELLGIRNGEKTKEEILTYAEALNAELEDAMQHSTIPNVPDFEKVNSWVLSAVDRTHGMNEKAGVLRGNKLAILPVDYEMVDQCTLFLVSNPLVRKLSKSEANGLVVPYKDWFTGLRSFSEFKFDQTTIEHIHKFASQVRACNPRHLDTIFAPEDKFLHKHPESDRLLTELRKLPSKKRAYHTAKGFITGNLKKMTQWENKKKEWQVYKQAILDAKKVSKEEWEAKLDALEARKDELKEKYRKEKDILIKQYNQWLELSNKKGNQPYLPPIPDKTPNPNASMIGKFEYDTLLASELYHVVCLFTELLESGTIQNSRLYENEMYAIKHGKYKTFEEFEDVMKEKLVLLDAAYEHGALQSSEDIASFEVFMMDFIQEIHETL